MAVDFSGEWHNQHGSWMDLKVAKGVITGTYHTAVGAPKPQDTFGVTGLVSDDILSFIVSWKNPTVDYQSLTAWVGQMTKDDDGVTDRIETLWHLARNVPDNEEPAKLWGSVQTGSDRFRRNPFPNIERVVRALRSTGSEPLAITREKVKRSR